MKTIDEIAADKILDLLHQVLAKIFKPDITIDKVSELNKERIKQLKAKYGIEALILDVDRTLRKEMKSIPKCNQEWLEDIKGELKIIILSNGMDKKIEKYFKEKGIDYIGFANKPLKGNFFKACKKLDVNPENVLMVGNSLFLDIYGGKRNNMKTALVKDVEKTPSER